MKEILLHRKLNRFGTIIFNFGMFLAILLFFSVVVYILIALFWVVAVLALFVVIVFTLGTVLANEGNRAFIGEFFSAPMQNIDTIQLITKECAIPFCIVSCLSFIIALVFFFIIPNTRGKTSKIVFCFLGIILAVVSAFLTYNIAIHG